MSSHFAVPDWWPNAACSRFVVAGGFRLHTQMVGEGPLLLLLHGTGAGGFSFAPLVERLARAYRCLMIDLPGHAFTAPLADGVRSELSLAAVTAVVRETLRVLDAHPVGIVGHSAGAAIGWELLRTEQARSYQLLGVNAALVPPPRAYDWLGRWWMAPLASSGAVARGLSALASRADVIPSTLRQTGSTVPPLLARCYAACASMPAHVQGAMQLMGDWELRPFLRSLRGRSWPVHLLHGADDPWIAVDGVRRAISGIGGVTFDVEPGGHLLHEEAPDLVASRVRALWRYAHTPSCRA
jgi:magnesium chelatase accessory protein